MGKLRNIVGNLSGRWAARRGDAPVLIVIAIFFTVVFAEVVFGGKFVLAGDPLYYSYPLRTVGWEMIRGGQPPLWTPLILSGYPLLSMSQLAFAYPVTWGYLFLPGHLAEHIYVLAPFLLSPFFTYAYAREIGRSRPAALLAGLAFGYGGMMCSGISFTGMPSNSMLWLPLLLIPIDRAARRRGRFAPLLLGATAAYAMSVLNGQGQSFLYTGMVAAAYGLYLSLFPLASDPTQNGDSSRSSGSSNRGDQGVSQGFEWSSWSRWRPLFVALGALLMSAGIAAFQILETMRAARRSIRSTLSYEEISSGSFTLRRAAASLVAPLYHAIDVTAYVPPLALVLIVLTCVALVRRQSDMRDVRDTRIYFWLGAAAIAWVLMLGSNTPLHQIVYRLPLLNKFRIPSRHAFEWTFAASVLAAYGWDIAAASRWLSSRPERESQGKDRRRLFIERAVIGLLLSLCVAVGFLWWRAMQVAAQPGGASIYTGLPESTFFGWKLAFTLLTLLLLWRSWRMAAAPPRWRTGLLMTTIALACVVEPAAAVSRWFDGLLLTAERFSVVSPTTRFLQNYPPEENRVYTRVDLYADEFTPAPRLEAPNLNALHGIQNIAGYEPLMLERYSRALGGVGLDAVSPRAGYAHNLDLFESQSHVLDLLNTTHVISFSNFASNTETLINKDGMDFAPSDAGAAVAPAQTLMFGGGGVEGDTFALVSVLSSSGELKQGAVVAKVRFHFAGAPVVERELRAGIDTAEWAHERADVRVNIQHALAPVFDARPGDEAHSFSKYHYLARVPLGTRGRLEKFEITNITERSPLNLVKATLYDSASGSSTPLSLVASEWWEVVYQKDQARIMRNRRALPRAWLVAAAEAVDGEEALRRIRGESDHEFDPRRTALMEVAPAGMPALAGGELSPESAAARVASYEPNRIVIETSATAATVLVVSEMIYPGWEATIDGAPAPIHPTNYVLRGVFVPAGGHRVEMRYRAPAARLGALISAFTLLSLGGLAIYDWRTRRRRPEAGSSKL